jgi:carbon-monoxide dehydrogenase medium subunit
MTEYCTPTSIDEVVDLLDTFRGTARIVAGGTDVLPDIRKGKLSPRCLVDVTRIPGLDRIEVTDTHVVVGAAVTFAQIKAHPFLNEQVHALPDAARSVGAHAIQSAATWVGNIVQSMPAADGAIIGIALEAEAQLVTAQGREWRPVEALFHGPGISTIDSTRQFVPRVRFPRHRERWGTAWQRIGRRPSLVLPILNCAVKLCLASEEARITHATLALGPVAPRPVRARKAEAALVGQTPSPALFEQVVEIARQEAQPRSSVMRASREYRLSVVPQLVREALDVALERARTSREV